MTREVPANFTQLLTEWRTGQPEALERLTPLVYDELRRLARGYMRTERGSHTLQATAVVHEAFLRLVQANVDLQDRQHFFALASRLMRRVLVDHAKSRSRVKRDGGGRDHTGVDLAEIAGQLMSMWSPLTRPWRACCNSSRAWLRSSNCIISAE